VTIAVDIVGDAIAESDENFYLIISNPQGGIFADNAEIIKASKTIMDND